MNYDRLKEQLITDEGRRNYVYVDHLFNFTAGVGHLLTDDEGNALTGKTLSEQCIDGWLRVDMMRAEEDCRELFCVFDQHGSNVQEVLMNMSFNLGRSRLATFVNMIADVDQCDYESAASEMRDSKWYRQTGARAERLCERMRYAE